jgi:hypothetical protein
MNTLAPILIGVVVLLPLLALMVCLYLWVQRHRQPDAARLKMLHCLLWLLFCVLLIWLASLIILGGSGITSAASVFLPLCSILIVAASIALQMRQCQQRLRQK